MNTVNRRTEDKIRDEIAELVRKKDIVLTQCQVGHQDVMAKRRCWFEYQKWNRKAKAFIRRTNADIAKLNAELRAMDDARKSEEGLAFAKVFMQNACGMLPKQFYDAIMEKTLVDTQKGGAE